MKKKILIVVADYYSILPEAIVYVFDNASEDRTSDVAQKAGATVYKEPNKGKEEEKNNEDYLIFFKHNFSF